MLIFVRPFVRFKLVESSQTANREVSEHSESILSIKIRVIQSEPKILRLVKTTRGAHMQIAANAKEEEIRHKCSDREIHGPESSKSAGACGAQSSFDNFSLFLLFIEPHCELGLSLVSIIDLI